eukprot:SAG31_NODE_28832_length_404_cov_1.350820_2_plen_40_part_01
MCLWKAHLSKKITNLKLLQDFFRMCTVCVDLVFQEHTHVL